MSDGYVPLWVTARTPGGFSAADPWSPSLDGILAYQVLRARLGEEEFALGMTGHRPLVVCEDLPLRRVEHDGQWWWAASAPQTERAGAFYRWFHRRFDQDAAMRYLPEGVRRVETAAGPYKAYRHRREVTLTPAVRWAAIGDPAAVRALVETVETIGFGGTKGWGVVSAWCVEPDPTAEMAAMYSRPLPVGYARTVGLAGADLQWWGIRPPGRHPEHQTLCVMP